MQQDEQSAEALRGMDALTATSISSVHTTFGAMGRTLDIVSRDCRAVGETLDDLGDALDVMTQGSGAGPDWSGFGMIGLPLMGAMRTVKAVVDQYVRQQTGVPLSTWTNLATDAKAQFESYVSQLDAVIELSKRYRSSTAATLDPAQARDDLERLEHLQWETQAWKQILGRVAQLGKVVDAVLRVDLDNELGLPDTDAEQRPSGFSGSVQRRIREVQARTSGKSGGLRDWVLRPFMEVRDRVQQLPAQTQRLAHEVALLELLLDLETAEIRCLLGEISVQESKIVGMRVAACVILPELAEQLTAARAQVQRYETFLGRLDAAREARTVDVGASAVLSEEYHVGLAGSRTRLSELEVRADFWRRHGRAVIHACEAWTASRENMLAARSLIEQRDAAAERGVIFRREQERLAEASAVLAAL